MLPNQFTQIPIRIKLLANYLKTPQNQVEHIPTRYAKTEHLYRHTSVGEVSYYLILNEQERLPTLNGHLFNNISNIDTYVIADILNIQESDLIDHISNNKRKNTLLVIHAFINDKHPQDFAGFVVDYADKYGYNDLATHDSVEIRLSKDYFAYRLY